MSWKTAGTATLTIMSIVVYRPSSSEKFPWKNPNSTKKEKRSKKERKQRPVETAGAVEKQKTVFPQLLEPDKTSGSQLPQARQRSTFNQRALLIYLSHVWGAVHPRSVSPI